jgi:hypothetical protein
MISLGRSYRLYGDAKNSLRYLDMAIKVCDDDPHGYRAARSCPSPLQRVAMCAWRPLQAQPTSIVGYQLRQLLHSNTGACVWGQAEP